MLNKLATPLSHVKMASTNDGYSFEGYATVWGGNDYYNDTIEKGAYSHIIEGVKAGDVRNPMLMAQHKHQDLPVGKIVKMVEDDFGFKVSGELTKGMSVAEDYKAAMQHGTIDGLSIGFDLAKDDFEEKSDGGRLIKRVTSLSEVSIVSFPADTAARIDLTSVKSALEHCQKLKDFEKCLRDEAGFSREAAKAFVSEFRSAVERDAQETKQSDLSEVLLNLKLRELSS